MNVTIGVEPVTRLQCDFASAQGVDGGSFGKLRVQAVGGWLNADLVQLPLRRFGHTEDDADPGGGRGRLDADVVETAGAPQKRARLSEWRKRRMAGPPVPSKSLGVWFRRG